MKFFVILLFFLAFSFKGFSQNLNETNSANHSNTDAEKYSKMWDAALGSFQFQIINSRTNPVIPSSVIVLIEENRLENKINYVDYKENIRIMILPKSEITKNYKKLEHIKYISAN